MSLTLKLRTRTILTDNERLDLIYRIIKIFVENHAIKSSYVDDSDDKLTRINIFLKFNNNKVGSKYLLLLCNQCEQYILSKYNGWMYYIYS